MGKTKSNECNSNPMITPYSTKSSDILNEHYDNPPNLTFNYHYYFFEQFRSLVIKTEIWPQYNKFGINENKTPRKKIVTKC